MSPFFAAIFLLGLSLANGINFTTVYEWDEFDFIWPSEADTSNGQNKQNFKSSKVYLDYMAVFGERLFLSLETQSGIDATLVWLPTSGSSTAPPKLAPFPSWNLHEKDNCDSIQSAKGVETDPDGRLWVLDNGSEKCPSKLWIFNLPNNDIIERVHQFPHLIDSNVRQLFDIVLDKTQDDDLAYITDYNSEQIAVYSRNMDKSWTVKTPGISWYSLALSANREARQLYLRRFQSKELYSMSVSELKNGGGSAAVKLIGEWNDEPYRMLIDSANVLYAALFNRNYLSKWNISEPFREQRFYEDGILGASWPFTFTLDPNGNLWMSERNATGSKTRHKLLKAAVGARSYLFSTSTALTTPPAQGTTSVTTSPRRIPVFKTEMSIPISQQISTTASSQHSSALPLATSSTTDVNGKTREVEKSLQTPTSKTGTGQPAVESNEICGGVAEDYRKSQSLVTILIWLFVCCVSCLVLSGAVIAWLTLRMRRMQTSLKQISMDNHAEMSLFPDDQVYDGVEPENSEAARPENPDESLYAEVGPEPLTSDYASGRTPSPVLYEEPLRLGNTNVGKPSEPVYDEVGSTEPENNYDDVGPGIAFRPPRESLQYLEVLPNSGETRL